MHFKYSKGPEEQFSLFGEVSPDMLRLSFYQDEESAARRMPRKHSDTPAPMEMDPLFDMDVLMSEFSDTLFSTLISHQSVPWPNPREIGENVLPFQRVFNHSPNHLIRLLTVFFFPPTFTAHAGNADMIQPGLIPLQPNLDFMDSFDPLQGTGKDPPPLPPLLPIPAVELHTH